MLLGGQVQTICKDGLAICGLIVEFNSCKAEAPLGEVIKAPAAGATAGDVNDAADEKSDPRVLDELPDGAFPKPPEPVPQST